MESFFYPKSIVIFGASKNENKSGNRVLKNILNYSISNVYLIHPKVKEIYGIQCYDNIFNLPKKEIDLAIIILPVEYVLTALEDCIEYHVKSIIIESGALYIKGQDDDRNKKRIVEIKKRLKKDSRTRVMGPNSIGLYCANKDKNNLTTSLIYFDKFPNLKNKNLSIISQTGLTLSGVLQSQNYIQEFGISKITAIGNKFDITESDILDFYANDPDTHVIALYLENIKDGPRFRKQCSDIIKNKPIIILKSGKTEKGKRAIISHTQSMAGDYKIIEALSKQIGFIIVDDFNEMFTIAKLILSQPIPKGNRIAVISISGAGTVISCDMAEKYGLEMPPMKERQIKQMTKIFPKFAWEDVYNPLDIWAAIENVGPDIAYKKAGEIFLDLRGYCDILIYLITGIKETEFNWMILKDLNENFGIPIYLGFLSGNKQLILKWREIIEEKCNIPTFESLDMMFKSIAKALRLKFK